MTEITHDFTKAHAVLAWNFLQLISVDVLNELTKQIYQIQAEDDEQAKFVKEDKEGKVLYETLRAGLDYLREKRDPEDWPEGMIPLVAWMVRDLVIEITKDA